MSDNDFSSFSAFFSDVLAQIKTDPIEHLLVLTYEFDDQQLVNLVASRDLAENFELRQNHMKILADLAPVVIYDARKTTEGARLPPFLELHPFMTTGYTCHHAKAYLIVTRRNVRLVLGSFNLTMTGLFRNREVFDTFEWREDATDNLDLLGQWISFIESAYESRLAGSSRSALRAIVATLKKRFAAWSDAGLKDRVQLLYSGYEFSEETGLAALRRHWDRWYPRNEPHTLTSVSPFFDTSTTNGCLATDLQELFPALEKFTLITDEAVKGLSQAHFGSILNRELLLIPKKLSSQERARIARLGKLVNEKAVADLEMRRALHAKVLLLEGDGKAMAYLGSANFTRRAWQGKNLELGMVWREENPLALRRALVSNLGALPLNRFDSLPQEILPGEVDQDDEEVIEDARFPSFIELILLCGAGEAGEVRFEFEFGARADVAKVNSITDYRIDWAGMTLDIDEAGRSQSIGPALFQSRLLGGRNLAFHPVGDASVVFFLPYQYQENLVENRETLMHPSSWDWMAFYLNPDLGNGDGTNLPGDDDDQEEAASPPGDGIQPDPNLIRDANPIIAMQRYLNSFTRIERDFRSRMSNAATVDEDLRSAYVINQVVKPLEGLLMLLDRETGLEMKEIRASGQSASSLFKMGELSLFLRDLVVHAPAGCQQGLQNLRKRIADLMARRRGAQGLERQYITYATNGGRP